MATELVVLQGLLRGLAERLGDIVDAKGVSESVLPAVAEALGAEVAVIAMRMDERTIRVISSVGMAAATTDPWVEFDVSAAVPLARSVRNSAPIWVPDVAAARAEFPALPDATTSRSAAALPLLDAGRVIGVLGVGWSEPRGFDESDRQLLLAVAALTAAACGRHPLPQTPRLRPHAHDGADGLAIACLARADGARCAVKGTSGDRSGQDVVFATLLDADPRLPSRTLDAVGGVLSLLRRRQGPPALVAQAIAEVTEDLDGPVTGAHVEIAPESGWIAVAPLDAAVVIASTSPAQGDPTPPTDSSLAGERVLFAGTNPAAVLVIALDTHTDEATVRSIAGLAEDVVRREPPVGAAELLDRFAGGLHTTETTPCVRGALAVSLDPRPELTGRARRLPAQPVATQLGRRFAVAALPEDADTEVAESVELITDELVANALRHAHDDVVVSVVDESTGTRIAVSDDDDRMPGRVTPKPDSESGRGLIVIEALADEVGTTERELGGKWVWARLHWRRPHR
jgi:anti-sigma regulatory factor (Ser/Thr protein kinase)